MGITRMGDLKRTKSGARTVAYRNKRNSLAGRPAANTRIGEQRIHAVRVRGGNIKMRALRLEHGNFAWASENVSRRTRILRVAYHASDNEFVRTNTLNRGSVVQIDSQVFKQWYENFYGMALGKSQFTRPEKFTDKDTERWTKNADHKIADNLIAQFDTGRIYAIITSRPGQCGRADGYILEGEELDFYVDRITKKK